MCRLSCSNCLLPICISNVRNSLFKSIFMACIAVTLLLLFMLLLLHDSIFTDSSVRKSSLGIPKLFQSHKSSFQTLFERYRMHSILLVLVSYINVLSIKLLSRGATPSLKILYNQLPTISCIQFCFSIYFKIVNF
jgi:predicted exporter